MPKFLDLIQYVDNGVKWDNSTNPNDNGSGLRIIKLSQSKEPGTTIMRGPDGTAQISDPNNDLDIANKKYVDDQNTQDVHLTGAQTISGMKTFNDKTILSGGATVPTNKITTSDKNSVVNIEYMSNAILTAVSTGQKDFSLTIGEGKYSVVQRRIKSNGSTVATEAYQRGTASFGGNTVAGDPDGDVNAYSFAFAANEENKAIARSSTAFGRGNRTYNPGEFVCGSYSEEGNRSPETVFLVGGGATADRRHNAFEVRTAHDSSDVNIHYSKAYIGGKEVATQDYVNYNSVHKEGNSYVVYINEANGKSTVMPYRFNKQSIVDGEYTLMFQPMLDGRLYTRYPTDEYHAANKGYVDKFAYNYLGESTVNYTTQITPVTEPAKVETIFFDNFNNDLTSYDSFYLKIEAKSNWNMGTKKTQYANLYINYNNEDEAVVVRKFSNNNRSFETIIAAKKNSNEKYLFEMSDSSGDIERKTSFSFNSIGGGRISFTATDYKADGCPGTIKVKLYGRRPCINE